MDLYTRGLILAGLFSSMLLLAGIALLVGRAHQRSKAAQDRFDVGKGRKRRKAPKKAKSRKTKKDRASIEQRTTEPSDSLTETPGSESGLETPDALPTLKSETPAGPSPFANPGTTTPPTSSGTSW